jgi:hypothetical protein
MGTPHLETDSCIHRHEIRAFDSPLPSVIALCLLRRGIISVFATCEFGRSHA